jgi:deoxyribodipyrimidine photo-lyase
MNAESAIIHPARIRRLNRKEPRDGTYVLYWMQQSQRAEENHALEYAVDIANRMRMPVVVCFGLTHNYPEANLRHYAFLMEGLGDVAVALRAREVAFVVRHGTPADVALDIGRQAALIVCDRGYLRHQREWREVVAREVSCPVVQVECDLIVPVETASAKREYAARTFRPKVTRLVPEFLEAPRRLRLRRKAHGLRIKGIPLDDDHILESMGVSSEVTPVPFFRGGTRSAKRILEDFVRTRLRDYARNRNQPQTDNVSHMSKYLHFGQISPSAVARIVGESTMGGTQDRDAFLDELIVRRELTYNFVRYTPDYDRYSSVPGWAKQSLEVHRADSRHHHYTRAQLERGKTHDPYWNAAMKEMRDTGYMHNYMRMYWGKKILEWSNTPEYAFQTALYLNNKYFIDGRDPNSYANVGWIFGLHDRPWQERSIFGKVRTMSARGLERKAHPEEYVAKVERGHVHAVA